MTAVISLDMKKKRIRIHKTTLELLNRPENIMILVNPETYMIAICPALPNKKDSLKVIYDNNADCEYYSKELMEQLSWLKSSIKRTYTYRITGELSYDRKIAVFDINKAVRYDTSDEPKENTGVSNNDDRL